ncbi:type II secretion system protein N [Paraglaciecola sp.]|uniref:type II secretion system protein N n=1 Tax=Paraglaciecola sp. TaxID=1920173 RepID=UPI00273FB6DA|nr:type II secretion system protein N [Paraglaciecola sp.]MDP5030406.1 type II secretion system protein N [Paraglaciecola sp.]
MKKQLSWVIFGILVYLIFLLIKLPATQVLSRLTLPPDVNLQGVSGTIWQGQAISATVQGLPLQHVQWSLNFLPLLMGQISADVSAGNMRQTDQISLSGSLNIARDRVQMNDVQAYLPTNLVISMLPLPFPVKAEGRFKLQVSELDYAQACHTLVGQGQWLNAQVEGLQGLIDLGNFNADMRCESNNIVLSVKEPNRFGLSADAVVSANLQYSINGRFKPDTELPEEVHQAAQFFGQKDKDGYYPLKF